MPNHSRSLNRTVLSAFLLVAIVALLSPSVSAQRPFVSETALQGFHQYTSLALDSKGQPHIAAWDINNFWLVYVTKSDGVWSMEIIFANAFTGTTTNIAVDSQDRVHVLWNGFGGGGVEVRYAMRSGGVWSASEMIAGGEFASMALGPDDTPHGFFTQFGNVYYIHRNGGWSMEFVTGSSTSDYETSCAVDALGRPHLGYCDNGVALTYGFRSGSTWTLEDIGTGLGALDIRNHDLVLDAQGYPQFVYYNDFAGNYSLVRKTRGQSSWNSPDLIATLGDVGRYCEMDLDANGRPLVAALYGSSGDLQFWERPDSGWTQAQSVDHVGDTGHYSSMALDAHGNPAIAYINNDTGDIHYADSGIRLVSDPVGDTWPVGSQREITWRGGGAVDIRLSTDGGASYDEIATNETGGSDPAGGTYVFTVPHQPSRFCKVQVLRHAPYSVADSDSFFTIETSISLLALVSTPEAVSGNLVTWQTDPGPEDLGSYRLERGRNGAWRTVAPNTINTSYHDSNGRDGDGYRLYASNRLGQEFYLGESSGGTVPSFSAALNVWPVPLRNGDLHISYPTGAAGGVAAQSQVAVYDVAGRRVAMIEQGNFAVGIRDAVWNGRGDNGRLVPSGIYFVRAVSGGVEQTRKFAVVR